MGTWLQVSHCCFFVVLVFNLLLLILLIIIIILDIDKLEEELRQELAEIESIFVDGGINIPEGGNEIINTVT